MGHRCTVRAGTADRVSHTCSGFQCALPGYLDGSVLAGGGHGVGRLGAAGHPGDEAAVGRQVGVAQGQLRAPHVQPEVGAGGGGHQGAAIGPEVQPEQLVLVLHRRALHLQVVGQPILVPLLRQRDTDQPAVVQPDEQLAGGEEPAGHHARLQLEPGEAARGVGSGLGALLRQPGLGEVPQLAGPVASDEAAAPNHQVAVSAEV
jgi:hypothetical protein